MVESVDGVGELLEDLKKSTFEKYDAFTVGEVFNMKPDELPEFIGETGHFSTIFDFSAHTLTDGEHGWYDAPKLEFAKWRAAIIQAQLETQKYGLRRISLKITMSQEGHPDFCHLMLRHRTESRCLVP